MFFLQYSSNYRLKCVLKGVNLKYFKCMFFLHDIYNMITCKVRLYLYLADCVLTVCSAWIPGSFFSERSLYFKTDSETKTCSLRWVGVLCDFCLINGIPSVCLQGVRPPAAPALIVPACLSVCLYFCCTNCLSGWISACLSVCLSVCLSLANAFLNAVFHIKSC